MLTEDQQYQLQSLRDSGASQWVIDGYSQSFEADNARTPEENERLRKSIAHVLPRYMSECPAGYVHVERTVYIPNDF
jgi:hypothetical protein